MSGLRRTTLGECCEIVSGATPSTSVTAYWDGDIEWATPKDLSDLEGKTISRTARRITDEGLASCAASVLPPNSVLFSSRAPIGHVAINTVPMATNQGFKSFVPKATQVEPSFLYHWLRAHRAYLEGLGNGATFKEVSKAVVSRIEIDLPPLAEQRRIADLLDKADAIRRRRKEAIALTEELLRSAFLDMFGDPVTNPKGWPIRELNEFVRPERPITYGILMPGPDVQDGVPYVRVVDMQGGRVNIEGVRRTTSDIDAEYRRSRLRAGDLLMSIRGHVGRVAVIPEELHGANITQDTARIAPVGLDTLYLMNLIESHAIQFWMFQHVRGVAVKGLNIGDLRRLPVPVPPDRLQQRYRTLVETTLRTREAVRAALSASDYLFSSLVARAFPARLRPRVDDLAQE